jgi:hypothetical protein
VASRDVAIRYWWRTRGLHPLRSDVLPHTILSNAFAFLLSIDYIASNSASTWKLTGHSGAPSPAKGGFEDHWR